MPLSSSDCYFCQCFLGFVKRGQGDNGGTAESCPDAAPQAQDLPFIQQILDDTGFIIATALAIFPADPLPVLETRIEHTLPLESLGCTQVSWWRVAGYDGVYG